jgi:hypothetical protein
MSETTRYEPTDIDRGFYRGRRFVVDVEGTKIGGAYYLTEDDRAMLTACLLSMSKRPSSLTCNRVQVGRKRAELIAFLEVWDDDVAVHIVETIRQVVKEPYGLHVRGVTAIGRPAERIDYREAYGAIEARKAPRIEHKPRKPH